MALASQTQQSLTPPTTADASQFLDEEEELCHSVGRRSFGEKKNDKTYQMDYIVERNTIGLQQMRTSLYTQPGIHTNSLFNIQTNTNTPM